LEKWESRTEKGSEKKREQESAPGRIVSFKVTKCHEGRASGTEISHCVLMKYYKA